MESTFMPTSEIAKYFGVCNQTIYNWHNRGRIPACYIVGRRTRIWKRSEIMDWIEARRVQQEELDAKYS